jgi:ankyrin repeat protein
VLILSRKIIHARHGQHRRRTGWNEGGAMNKVEKLFYAARTGNLETVEQCFVAGVEPNIVDSDNNTPLHRNCKCINMLQCYYINNYSIL